MQPSPRSGHISSRLARNEQKKMVRQTFMFGGLAVILLVAFLFVILPQSVRLVGSLTGGTGSPFEVEDTIPPQTPVLAAPPVATPSGSIKISGIGEAQSQVVLVVNGSEQNRVTAGDDGNFEFDVQLADGSNQISVYAIDKSENESPTSQGYTVVKDAEPPKLEVSQPQDGQQIELRRNQVTTIAGTSEPKVRIMVNGRLVFAREDGSFSTTYQLQEGENKLLIVATDEAGNQTSKELTVNFRP